MNKWGLNLKKVKLINRLKKPLLFNGFRNHSMKLLENILNNEALEREIKHNTKKHIEPAEYREKWL